MVVPKFRQDSHSKKLDIISFTLIHVFEIESYKTYHNFDSLNLVCIQHRIRILCCCSENEEAFLDVSFRFNSSVTQTVMLTLDLNGHSELPFKFCVVRFMKKSVAEKQNIDGKNEYILNVEKSTICSRQY